MAKGLFSLQKLLAGLSLVMILSGCDTPKMSVADAQYQRGEYYNAAQTYRKLYNSLKKQKERPLRGEVARKLAECESRIGRHGRASAAYRNAIRYSGNDSLQLNLAKELHADGKYKEALETYNLYLTVDSTNREAITGRNGAKMALSTGNRKTRYRVSPAKFANSRRSEYSPFLADGGNRLYFTTTNENVSGLTKSGITGMKNGDIWMSKKNEQGVWQTPEPVNGEVNSESDEGAPSISADGKTMFFSRSFSENGADEKIRIFISKRSDAEWGEPELFELLNDSAFNFAHPSVSPDGKFLYFTSDRRGGEGKTDIWRLRLDRQNARPENLGKKVNTVGREMFPTAVSDSLFYFASDGHPGFGGLDIFRATLQKDGTWDVANMGQPINSSSDDFGITFVENKEAGFFSSSRGDARGYDNLYSFELPDLNIRIEGIVTDFEEEPIIGATIRIVGRDGSNRMTRTRDDGSFELPLDRGVEYTMLAGAKGYMNARQEFESDDSEEDAVYTVDFMLASMTEPNIVENIFYDFDRATLRPESKEALDGLVKVLETNSGIKVELSAHADRKGSESYNKNLSERRAKAVVDYLVKAGINPQRLTWTGYGKTQPKRVTKRIAREYPQFEEGTLLDEAFIDTLDEEDREVADQINRRTEFTVTGNEKW
ncbi:MAG: PD40 domain-containing protein [Paramuribaculum sp.]|nr:PD40 domain-containing protein [Paramuribaculum sp.]